MMIVCRHHLERFRDSGGSEGARLSDPEVNKAAGKIVSGLSLARLVELENKTNTMLRSGQPVDGEFWDLVLKKIHVEKAIVSCMVITLILGQIEFDPRSCPQEPTGTIQETATRGCGTCTGGTGRRLCRFCKRCAIRRRRGGDGRRRFRGGVRSIHVACTTKPSRIPHG